MSNVLFQKLFLLGAVAAMQSKLMAMEQVRGKRGQALQIEQKQAASAEQGFGIGLEVKAGVAEVKADAEAKIEAARAGQVKPLWSLCADAITSDIPAAELLEIYKVAQNIHESQMVKAVIAALPGALVNLAHKEGLQAVEDLLDTTEFQQDQEAALKNMLMQQHPWIRYCCGEPEVEKLFNISKYVSSRTNGNDKFAGRLNWKFDATESLSLISLQNIFFPSQNNLQLQHPDNHDVVTDMAVHQDGNKLVTATSFHPFIWPNIEHNGLFFWQRSNDGWQHLEVDPLHQAYPVNHEIISVHWIDQDSLVTISGRYDAWRSHHWKLQNNNLVLEKTVDIPLLLGTGWIHPFIKWSSQGVMFRAIGGPIGQHNEAIYEYQGDAWHRTEFVRPERIRMSSGMLEWGAAGDALYFCPLNKNFMYFFRRDDQGSWQPSQLAIHEKVISERQNPFNVYDLYSTFRVLSPDNSVLVVRKRFRTYSIVSIYKNYENAWHKAYDISIDETHDDAKVGPDNQFCWNSTGSKLALGSLFGDVHVLHFDQIDKLSFKELLVSLVIEKLKDTQAGKVALNRDDQALRSFASNSTALKKALRIEPKWYTKAYVNKKVNTISKWMRRHPKTTLALCAAGAVVAYYARKKRWVKKAATAVYDPLVAYLKRKRAAKSAV